MADTPSLPDWLQAVAKNPKGNPKIIAHYLEAHPDREDAVYNLVGDADRIAAIDEIRTADKQPAAPAPTPSAATAAPAPAASPAGPLTPDGIATEANALEALPKEQAGEKLTARSDGEAAKILLAFKDPAKAYSALNAVGKTDEEHAQRVAGIANAMGAISQQKLNAIVTAGHAAAKAEPSPAPTAVAPSPEPSPAETTTPEDPRRATADSIYPNAATSIEAIGGSKKKEALNALYDQAQAAADFADAAKSYSSILPMDPAAKNKAVKAMDDSDNANARLYNALRTNLDEALDQSGGISQEQMNAFTTLAPKAPLYIDNYKFNREKLARNPKDALAEANKENAYRALVGGDPVGGYMNGIKNVQGGHYFETHPEVTKGYFEYIQSQRGKTHGEIAPPMQPGETETRHALLRYDGDLPVKTAGLTFPPKEPGNDKHRA